MIRISHLLGGVAAASAVLVAVPTVASAATSAPAAPTAQDVSYLKGAMATDLFEIVTGGVAVNKAHYPTTRAYAKRVVKDHAKALFDARKIAMAEGVAVPDALSAGMKAKVAELNAKSGTAFDVAYLSAQVPGHFTAVAAGTKEIIKGSDPAIHDYAAANAHVLRYHLWRGNLDLRYVRWAIRTHRA